VKSAGHGQIGLTDVQPWRGSKEAYHTLLPLLREEPANNNIWRNALQALVGISLGSPVREKLTLEGLERFAVDANSFSLRGRQPVLGVNVFADGTENWAAYNAKHDVPRLIGVLARNAAPEVAQNARRYLTESSAPSFWEVAAWPSTPYYGTSVTRALDMAFLSAEALASGCSVPAEERKSTIDSIRLGLNSASTALPSELAAEYDDRFKQLHEACKGH